MPNGFISVRHVGYKYFMHEKLPFQEGGNLRKSKFAKYMARLKLLHAAPLLILGPEESDPSLLYLPGRNSEHVREQ